MPDRARGFRIRVLNQVSRTGLDRLPASLYTLGPAIAEPHAILLRSADLHGAEIPATVKAIARAGAGTNNVPVDAMSLRGVPVFNAPGANANAVKELVLAGMLLSARNLPAALRFVDGLDAGSAELERTVEDGKKAFSGFELAGHTLGVIGLGRIGCLVADAAIRLGMQVIGYDPEITVDAAWSLPAQVRRAQSVPELLRGAHFVSLHVPLFAATRGLIDARALDACRPGTVLLNFSREGVVDEPSVRAALDSGTLRHYVSDFPTAGLLGHPRCVALPHLGASTLEAEENCAVMVVDQLRDYLEHGNVRNAVNFPDVTLARESEFRVAIANANVPNMLGQISTAMAQVGLNIHNMLNKSRGEVAYTLVDIDSPVPPEVIAAIERIAGVLSVRDLPLAAVREA
jgi:D-3-phosphoglycerate dehydrogenase